MGKSLQTLGERGTSCARLLTTLNYLPVIGDMRHLNFFTATRALMRRTAGLAPTSTESEA
jgi:hypothetical protein